MLLEDFTDFNKFNGFVFDGFNPIICLQDKNDGLKLTEVIDFKTIFYKECFNYYCLYGLDSSGNKCIVIYDVPGKNMRKFLCDEEICDIAFTDFLDGSIYIVNSENKLIKMKYNQENQLIQDNVKSVDSLIYGFNCLSILDLNGNFTIYRVKPKGYGDKLKKIFSTKNVTKTLVTSHFYIEKNDMFFAVLTYEGNLYNYYSHPPKEVFLSKNIPKTIMECYYYDDSGDDPIVQQLFLDENNKLKDLCFSRNSSSITNYEEFYDDFDGYRILESSIYFLILEKGSKIKLLSNSYFESQNKNDVIKLEYSQQHFSLRPPSVSRTIKSATN